MVEPELEGELAHEIREAEASARSKAFEEAEGILNILMHSDCDDGGSPGLMEAVEAIRARAKEASSHG